MPVTINFKKVTAVSGLQAGPDAGDAPVDLSFVMDSKTGNLPLMAPEAGNQGLQVVQVDGIVDVVEGIEIAMPDA